MEACSIYGGNRIISGLFDGDRVLPQQPLAWYQCLPDLLPDYFPVEKGGRWGLMETKSGRLAVPFRYEAVELPDGDLFAAKDEGWGVMDLEGRMRLPFRYDALELQPKNKTRNILNGGIGENRRGTWGRIFLFI